MSTHDRRDRPHPDSHADSDSAPPLSPFDHAVICVPVRNEERRLPALLAALAAQTGEAPDASVPPASVPPASVHLLLDGCTDGSEAIVRAAAPGFPMPLLWAQAPASAEPNAGRARRRAVQLGLDAARAVPGEVAVLTTDADSTPAPDWLLRACAALAEADLVAGAIARRRPDPLQDRLERYCDALHALRRQADPVPWEAPVGHHQTGGANLAVRRSAYLALGGFPEKPCGEDAALVDAAHHAGLRVRRDAAVRVTTSSRRVGRAPCGLAQHLRDLERDGLAATLVEHPADALRRFRLQAAARRAFDSLSDLSVVRLARAMGAPTEHVLRVAADSRNAESFAMRVVTAPRGGERQVSLPAAEAALAALQAPPLGHASLGAAPLDAADAA